ncbi:hypothetical protein [Piscicoccus intestinalis]|uniref:hypothetical protein n=1 Tax=Piscicoccus intestinalis TaxID=746033 RepID=UPI000837DCCC|nr:hypothetical protein [Piscicoccus intestinalis]
MGRISDYLGLTGGSDPHAEIARLRRRVDALEAALREVCERTGVDPAIVAAQPAVDAEVLELVRTGQKIHAVKLPGGHRRRAAGGQGGGRGDRAPRARCRLHRPLVVVRYAASAAGGRGGRSGA